MYLRLSSSGVASAKSRKKCQSFPLSALAADMRILPNQRMVNLELAHQKMAPLGPVEPDFWRKDFACCQGFFAGVLIYIGEREA